MDWQYMGMQKPKMILSTMIGIDDAKIPIVYNLHYGIEFLATSSYE